MGSDTRWWLMDGLGVVGADAVGGGGSWSQVCFQFPLCCGPLLTLSQVSVPGVMRVSPAEFALVKKVQFVEKSD